MSIPENPYITGIESLDNDEINNAAILAWQEGTAAIVKWGDEKCMDHPRLDLDAELKDKREVLATVDLFYDGKFYYAHRKDCPQCWQELKENMEIGI